MPWWHGSPPIAGNPLAMVTLLGLADRPAPSIVLHGEELIVVAAWLLPRAAAWAGVFAGSPLRHRSPSPTWWRRRTATVLTDRLQPPSAGHWLGTDELGRDIYSRIVYGARVTLYIVGLVAILVGPIGLLVGTVAGYVGGWLDTVLMRITDIFLAFPRLILALAFVAALGPGIENAIIAIAITTWPPYARIARAETITLRHADFIAAASLQGASTVRIIWGHIMPMCTSSLIVRLTLDMAGIILTAAGLGFLGLGAQPPLPEMGSHDFVRAAISARAMVGRDDTRHRHLRRLARLQPAGRRPA